MDQALLARFALDPAVTFLNHGSFGACPRDVLAVQSELRERMERQPVRFFARELPVLLDDARAPLARFLHTAPERLAFVPNATAAVNAVLRWLPLSPGDELLTTDHIYNACNNVLEEAARHAGARVVTAHVPFPLASDDDVVAPVLAAVTPRTRLALLDHVTSPTGLVFPVARLVRELRARGVECLVDAAHAPGQVPLDVDAIGAAWLTGNCHKWLFAPKGAAFLAVRADKLEGTRPAVLSHGANAPPGARSRFQLEFDWVGTVDPTPWLAVPAGLSFGERLFEGGWPALMARNHALAVEARALLCTALGVPEPAPAAMIGALASVPLPDGDGTTEGPLYGDPLQRALAEQHAIEVPIVPWPQPPRPRASLARHGRPCSAARPRRLVRISAQAYNTIEQYRRLADALIALVGRAREAPTR
ncbi:MAG: aminotransferase class V-fold PLP-dependent enzyme [Deltaproteobacteria bacterium]|nr:aminotransferase class V-fold PLP-dependent enzyme [Deltaproteobacteria bacterium]